MFACLAPSLTAVQADKVKEMMSGAAGHAQIVLLGDRVLFGQGALFGHFVILYGPGEKRCFVMPSEALKGWLPAQILLRPHTHGLTVLQREVSEQIHLKGSSQSLIFLLDEHRQAVAASFG